MFDRISEKHNAQFNWLGLKAVGQSTCASMGKDQTHRRLVYVQLGRWVPDKYDDWHISMIVALILEEIGTALESLYRRVGLALITVDPQEETDTWPVQCFSVV